MIKVKTSVAKPAAAAAAPQARTELEILTDVSIMEAMCDAVANGEFDGDVHALDNLTVLKAMSDAKDPALEGLLLDQPEFVDLDREQVSAALESMIVAAQESVGTDILGNASGIFHGLIDAALHYKDHTEPALRKLIPEMKQRVEAADDKMFGKWKLLFQLAIFSKYLPDQNQWDGAVKALNDAAKYLETTDPKKFVTVDFDKHFYGTCYDKGGVIKKNEMNNSQAQAAAIAKNAAAATAAFIPFVGTAAWVISWNADIRKRGWTAKEHFTGALDDAEKMLDVMKSLADKATAQKAIKVEDKDEVVAVKSWLRANGEVIKLMGYLGRGIVAASRSIGGSVWRRLFTTDK